MNRLILSLTLLASLLFPSAEGDAAKVFGPMVKAPIASPSYSLITEVDGALSGPATISAALGTSANCLVVVGATVNAAGGAVVTTVTIGSTTIIAPDVIVNASFSTAIFSQYFATCPGTQTVTSNTSGSAAFQNKGLWIWVANNVSSLPISTANYTRVGGTYTPSSAAVTVATAQNLVFGLFSTVDGAATACGAYTPAPAGINNSVNYGGSQALDWTFASTASMTVTGVCNFAADSTAVYGVYGY